LEKLNNTTLEAVLREVVRLTRELYGKTLVSLIAFGSVARGDFSQGSDIDILIVLDKVSGSLGRRIRQFSKAMKAYWESEQYKKAVKEGVPRYLQPLILSVEELKSHPPILLDMTTDALVLYDRDQVFQREIEIIKKRMEELGSKRVYLDEKRWYWVLKPGMKIGEVVEI